MRLWNSEIGFAKLAASALQLEVFAVGWCKSLHFTKLDCLYRHCAGKAPAESGEGEQPGPHGKGCCAPIPARAMTARD